MADLYNYAEDVQSFEHPRTLADWAIHLEDIDQGTLDKDKLDEPYTPDIVAAWVAEGYLIPVDSSVSSNAHCAASDEGHDYDAENRCDACGWQGPAT